MASLNQGQKNNRTSPAINCMEKMIKCIFKVERLKVKLLLMLLYSNSSFKYGRFEYSAFME